MRREPPFLARKVAGWSDAGKRENQNAKGKGVYDKARGLGRRARVWRVCARSIEFSEFWRVSRGVRAGMKRRTGPSIPLMFCERACMTTS